ncbi:hypothetical protein QR680_000187 [Steinernema hermaphroditum]|uniref:Tyrosine-protein phosphatase domain-containing protein n=1 Tax=Steinernema hermaphroditum TaxID=289476 RepID=A0AA39GUH5_9BILA|nr:hypothetical protein QR680_000187 [Steinernema hermaphroditum]
MPEGLNLSQFLPVFTSIRDLQPWTMDKGSERRLTRTSSKVGDTAVKLNRNLSQSTMRRKSRSQSMVEQHTVQTDPKTRKTHSSNEPGLRSMLYGLAMKMEKEEAAMKKRQKKQLVQEEKAMQAAPSQPIDAAKFVAYVTERRKKRILFKGEYLMIQRSIDMQKCRSDVASTMDDRNAYPDTLPYDYNRVILHTMPGDENSHYINASYVNSWVREKAYVVTQAVKTKAANAEFWRMIWELGSNCIVMLTKVFDFMRVMCAQYWPITSAQFGEIEVETLETKTYAHFVIRTFRLKRLDEYKGLESRIVKHFHFTEWELDSFPYISAFIELRRRVRQHTEKCFADAPIVVHCRLVANNELRFFP